MRNPERIEKTLQLLHYIWREQPDTRFNQLIDNLQVEYANKNDEYSKVTLYKKEEYNNITSYMPVPAYDFFYLEDDAFVEFLEQKVREKWKI